MNTNLQDVNNANGPPLGFFMTARQVSDHTGAGTLMDDLPMAQWLISDRSYDADRFRDALQAKGITSCFPVRESQKLSINYDKRRDGSHRNIKIMFARLKD